MDALPTPPGSDDESQPPEFNTSTNKSYMQKQDFDNKSLASNRSKNSNVSTRSKTFKSFAVQNSTATAARNLYGGPIPKKQIITRPKQTVPTFKQPLQ